MGLDEDMVELFDGFSKDTSFAVADVHYPAVRKCLGWVRYRFSDGREESKECALRRWHVGLHETSTGEPFSDLPEFAR